MTGFVTATYPGHSPVKSAAVLFKTIDGGITWKPDRMLRGLPEGTLGWKVSSAVADSSWVIAKAPNGKPPTLINLDKYGPVNTGNVASDCATGMACLTNSQISFVTPMIGWRIEAGGGHLLSTTDGGATWNTITPGLHPQSGTAVEPNSNTALLAPSSATDTTATAAPAPPQPVTSRHLGFDKCGVPSVAMMQQWWTNSPYFDVAFYANGAASQCGIPPDTGLTPAWVAQVSLQGWGLIPIWSGPQAPCACRGGMGTYPNCTLGTYPHTFHTDPSTAATDGKGEAALAAASITSLGLAGTVIYYDMENYNSATTTS